MKWGTTELNVIKDSYIPPFAKPKLNVIEILPGADNTAPSSIIQQGGRGRYQVSFNGFVRNNTEYQALLDDTINLTERTFDGADGFTMNMIISDFTPTKRSLFPLKIEYSMTLMEV
ncbi:MAG: hypothetical protein K0R54_2228 [Clostridiaceae bacterium]|jgi:hypothetical protein|nr:hypothetical protein [Clostridiaceae bacterium]